MKANNTRETLFQPPWTVILDQYKVSLETANRSPKTVDWYLDILRRFFRFLESNKLIKPIGALDKAELRAYIQYLQNAKKWPNRKNNGKDFGKLSPSAVQGHVRAIKAFWSWLAREEYIEKNPLEGFRLPSIPKYLIPALTTEQVGKLLNAIDKTTDLGAKYYCLLILLLDTGMRISELVNIKMNNLDLIHGWVTVIGKGQKQRMCPFSGETRKQLVRYLRNSRSQMGPENSPYLFQKRDGEHISVNSVQQYMRRLLRSSGLVGVRCSPHIFRHTFATQALINEANVAAVRDIMGHTSERTTLKYTNFRADDIKTQHNRFSPVERLLKRRS